MKYTDDEKLRVLDREIRYRKRVYIRLVAEGRITKQTADYQTAVMEEIAQEYRERMTRVIDNEEKAE